ncbi:MAG: cysteine desulfurase [Erysipelotrichaceae bacterium]|nr:cysteine desulfurase [Erysipelotrichaceae bacterium]
MIYFDNAATTKTSPDLLELVAKLEAAYFANPSSKHSLGLKSKRLLEQGRSELLSHFGEQFKVIYTSGATEANNLFIKGAAFNYKNRGNKIITTVGEHPSILNACKQLQEHFNYEIVCLPLNEEGVINLNDLEEAIDEQTIIVSIIHCSSETGAINDLQAIKNITKNYPKVLFHSDVTQSIGKIPVDFACLDAFSFSAHKLHGLKGSGALILKKEIDLLPLFSGGNHEGGLRAGTENFIPNVLLAKTLRLSLENLENNYAHVEKLKQKFHEKLNEVEGIIVNSPTNSSPYIINFSTLEHKSSIIVEALSNENIMVSTTSACDAKSAKISKAVFSMYNDEHRAKNSVRISFSKNNKLEEVNIFIEALKNILKQVKKL